MVAEEIRRVPYEMLQVSYTLGAQPVRRSSGAVMWRAAKPGIFDALRLCNGWAWTYVVIAELVAANEGLGFRILKFSRFLQTPRIWVYLVSPGAHRAGARFWIPSPESAPVLLGRHAANMTTRTERRPP